MHQDSTSASTVKSASAQIIPIDRESRLPAEKAEYVAAIQLWCQTRNVADSLSRAEIGALKALDRIDAQRKAIIIHLAHYYRKHTRVDPAPAIAVITALMTDNDRGTCTVSQETFGRLLGRSKTSIRDAQKRLKDDGIIVMGRGRYAGSHPIIPRAVTSGYNHMTWLIGALCDEEKSINVPGGLAVCQSAGEPCGLNQSAGEPCGLDDFNPQGNEVQSAGGPCAYFTNTSQRENTRASKVAGTVTATTVGAAMLGISQAAAAPPPIEPPHDHMPLIEEVLDISKNMIAGPGFRIDLGAVDMTAELAMCSKSRARIIAEICARDWVASGMKPASPMAIIKRAVINDKHDGEIKDLRLENERKRTVTVKKDRGQATLGDFKKPAWEKDEW